MPDNLSRYQPNHPLQSLRLTESDCIVPSRKDETKCSKKSGSSQDSRVQSRHSASCGSQAQFKIQGQSRIAPFTLDPNCHLMCGDMADTDESRCHFQPVDRPTAHSESLTGLLKPLPIKFSKWNKHHRIQQITDVSDKGIEDIFLIQNASRDDESPVNRSSDVFSDSRSMYADARNKSKGREPQTTPLVSQSSSLNSVSKSSSFVPARCKKRFPNASNTVVEHVQHPSPPDTIEDDVSSTASSVDVTLVGHHSRTTEDRPAELNDSRDISSPGTAIMDQASLLCDGLDQSSSTSLYVSADEELTGTVKSKSSLETFDEHTLVKDSTHSSPSFTIDDGIQMEKDVFQSPPDEIRSHQEGMQNVPLDQMMHWAKLGSYVRKCYENSRVCDVRFFVGNEVLFAHRFMLCSVSPYFASIFNENSHPNSKLMADVHIRGVSMRSLKSFVDFVYTGQLEMATPMMLDLMKISRHFEVPEIRQRCVQEIAFLPDEDLILLLIESREKMETGFIDSILRFISERFLAISQCESFLDLDVETLCIILSHDGLNTATEADVLRAAMQWIYRGSSQRSQVLERVMKCVRFPLMTQLELFDCINKNCLLRSNERCLDMIHKANWIRTALALNMHDPLELDVPNPRCRSFPDDTYNNYMNYNASHTDLLDISFGSIENDENCTKRVAGYEISTEPQSSPKQIQRAREQHIGSANTIKDRANEHNTIDQSSISEGIEPHSMTVLGGKLYVIGGFHPQFELPQRDVWVYSPRNGWRSLAPMKTTRMHHTLCVLDGCIYAIGGVGRNNRVLRSVECYDPVTDRWQFVKSMTTARAGASAAELDGKIFVSGGFGNTLSGMPPILDSVEVFHPLKNRWAARGRLRFGRCHANMTCVGGTLYLSGGLAVDSNMSRVLDVEDVDIYDAQNDSWWLCTCLDKARHSAAYFVSGQKLFLIGGIALNSKGTLKNSIECLDTRSNSWLATFELPSEVLWIRSVI